MAESDSATVEKLAEQKDALCYCPVCSTELVPAGCKMVCPVCRYYLSCSDFY